MPSVLGGIEIACSRPSVCTTTWWLPALLSSRAEILISHLLACYVRRHVACAFPDAEKKRRLCPMPWQADEIQVGALLSGQLLLVFDGFDLASSGLGCDVRYLLGRRHALKLSAQTIPYISHHLDGVERLGLFH
jgi:hypothetical protein